MGSRLHKRLSRARLYKLRRDWLRCQLKGEGFRLWNRTKSNFRTFPEDIEGWLHKDLMYIRNEANTYRGKFNFSFLTELAEKEFGRSFVRCIRDLRPLVQVYYISMIVLIIYGFH